MTDFTRVEFREPYRVVSVGLDDSAWLPGDCPARIPVFLGEPCLVLFPAIGNPSLLDRLFLLNRVALLGRCDDRSVDNLAAQTFLEVSSFACAS